MTASRHLSLTGGAHYLAKHLGKPETTVVGSDLYLAPVPPAQLQSMSGVPYPDLFIAFDADPAGYLARNGYVISEQGKPPDFVLEIASRSTGRRDTVDKRISYAALGHPGNTGASTKPDSSTALASPATASSAANMNRCPSRHSPTAASRATAPSSASTCAGPKANWAGMTPTPAGTSPHWSQNAKPTPRNAKPSPRNAKPSPRNAEPSPRNAKPASRRKPSYRNCRTSYANCAANDHLKQPARQSRPSFSPREQVPRPDAYDTSQISAVEPRRRTPASFQEESTPPPQPDDRAAHVAHFTAAVYTQPSSY